MGANLGSHFPGGLQYLSALVKELPRVGLPEGLTVQGWWFMKMAAPSFLLQGVKGHLSASQPLRPWDPPQSSPLCHPCPHLSPRNILRAVPSQGSSRCLLFQLLLFKGGQSSINHHPPPEMPKVPHQLQTQHPCSFPIPSSQLGSC